MPSDTVSWMSESGRPAQVLHDTISQIAAIRLQSEILLLAPAGNADESTRAGLQDIVALTEKVQQSLLGLLEGLPASERACD